MKNLIRKIIKEETTKLLNESGIRSINDLAKRYQMAKIYFHMDLDGVTTALAMKEYLEKNGIKVVDAETIQYGDKEFAVKKPEGEGEIMPVLVDFAHGKPMYIIHTDHHDTQAGVESGTATSFRPSRSNVETISQVLSPKDIFTQEDIELINMVDSADFAKYDITPSDVMNYLFKIDRERDVRGNKRMMGLVANKLLLAFKNKKGFLKQLVLNSKPSLLNILLNIKNWMKENGFLDLQQLEKNKESYVERQKTSPNVKVIDGIITQYGAGNVFDLGSYDRYTPFKNNPDADFLLLVWPMGMIQASCNPFKKDRALKGVNLGEVKDEVLKKFEPELKEKKIPLSTIKWISENSKDFGEGSVGFTFKDFMALYPNSFNKSEGSESYVKMLESIMSKPFSSLTDKQREVLDKITISAWDLIDANSGGHKCITNISGLSYLDRSKRPPVSKYYKKKDGEDAEYVKIMKRLGREFFATLRDKIKQSNDERYEPGFEVEMNEYGRSLKNARRQGQGTYFPKSAIKANPLRFRPENR
jgi:hypothetical protein